MGDAAALERVLMRVAGTDEPSLEGVLDKLLPLVIAKLDTPDAAVKGAVLKILSHINTRIAARSSSRTLGLPSLECAKLAASPCALVSNTALVYVDLAARSAKPDPAARTAALPFLARGAAARPPAQRDAALRLGLGGLAGWRPPRDARAGADTPPDHWLSDPADRKALIEFGTDVLLFRPPTLESVGGGGSGGGGGGGALGGANLPPAPSINTPLGAALAAAAAAAGTAAPTRRVAAPGQSLAGADRVMGGEAAGPPPAAWLASLKAGLLEWASAPVSGGAGLAAVVGPPEDAASATDARRACVLWSLIASAEGGGSGGGVQARGEEILRRRSVPAVGASRDEDPLENVALASAVLDLVVGHTAGDGGGGGGASAAGPSHATTRTPPSPALVARSLSLLCRSRAAASAPCFPAAAAAIEAAVFTKGAPAAVVQAGAEFCVWVLRHAPAAALADAAPAILHRLLGLLEGEDDDEEPQPMDASAPAAPAIAAGGHHHHHHHGPPAPPATASPAARSFAWQALGQLATRVPGALQARPDVAARLFTALAAEPDGVRAAAQEAVACVATAYAGVSSADPTAAAELCSLLTQAVTAPAEAVRVCAAVWAGTLFPRSHVQSRWVCVLAAGDGRLAVREAGEAGLASGGGTGGAPCATPAAVSLPPAAKRPKGGRAGGDGMEVDGEVEGGDHLPPVSSILATARAAVPALARPPPSAATVAAGGGELPLPASAFSALLKFCRACRKAEAEEGGAGSQPSATAAALLGPGAAAASTARSSPSTPPPDEYLDLVDLALASSDAPGALRRDALDALLDECAGGHASALGSRYAPRLAFTLRPHLAHTDPGGRGVAAKLVGVAARALPSAADRAALLGSLTEVAGGGGGGPSARPRSGKGTAAAASSGGPARFEARDGAAAAVGTVLAALIAGGEDGSTPGAAEAAVATLTALLSEPPQHVTSAATALGHAGLAGPLPGGPTAVVAGLAALIAGKDPAAAAAAAVAVGRVAGGDPTCVSTAVDALLAVATARSPSPPESVVLAAGEGLVWALGGHGATPDDVLAGPFVSLAARSVVAASAGGEGDGGGGGGDGTPLPPVEASPPPPPVAAARERVLTALATDLAVSSTAPARAAGCVWLVSLLTCAPAAAAVRAAAGRAQAVFLALLADPNELIQDAAPRGLCACYALAESSDGASGKDGGRDALLAGLADALSGGGAARARATIKVDDDSKVDGLLMTAKSANTTNNNGTATAAGSSSAPASLATMRELASLANDMGQPDLVYRFAQLTARAAALRSSRGAALGMASLAALPGGAAALAPVVARLTPRLVRGLHDPHPAVRDAMATIWGALVPDPQAAIDAARPRIAADLVTDAGGKEARVREAALSALADLVGRPAGAGVPVAEAGWSGLGPVSAAPALAAALRCADDVKPSVRAAGVSLARSLRAAALRACESAGRSAGNGAAAAAAVDALSTLLPALTDALASPATDVRALALDGLAALAGGAPPRVLAPLLPSIVPPVLESLSGGAETGMLNYVDAHLAAAGEDAAGSRAALEDARLAASRSGKAATILDAAVSAAAGAGDADAVAAIIPPLVGAVKRGVGASTRAGAARVVSQLAARVPAAQFSPHAGKLLAALLAGARADAAGGAVRRAYASAAAAVLKVAPPSKAAAFIDSLAALVAADGGEPQDRELAGSFALACARGASDTWATAGGPAALLPKAAVWRHDPDTSAGAPWVTLWDETAPGGGAAVRLYGADLASAAASALGASAWGSKAAAAKAVTAAAAAGGALIAPHAAALADRLRTELGGGRYFEGKADLAAAVGALAAAAPAEAGGRACLDALASVLSRPGSRPELKTACLAALAAVAAALPPADVAAAAAPAVAEGLALYAARRAAEAAGEVEMVAADGVGDVPVVRPAPISSLLAALPLIWKASERGALVALSPAAATGVGAALAAGVSWDVRVAACSAVSALAAALPAGGAAAALAAWAATLGDALVGAAGEPKHASVRSAAADALAALAGAALAPPGSPAAAALDKLVGDANDSVKARAVAAKARAAAAVKAETI